ncbi:MAG: hypothetical protein EOP11_01380 [Proteobacteria bacterium]|nr:MAG: hypothetical protein EOP11_01380 [Pseudomonadota bacterium]
MKSTLGGLWVRHRYLRGAFFVLFFYLLATQLSHTLLYTVVAYIVSAAEKKGTDFGNTVNEIAGQYHFFAYAMAALLMAITTWRGDRALYRSDVFWNEPHKPAWQLDRNAKGELWGGAGSGLMAAGIFLPLFYFSGRGNFLGVYLTSTFGTPVFPLFFLDILSLGTLLFCEEYIFRHKILRLLSMELPPLAAMLLTGAAHILVKWLQFELTTLDLLSLALFNLALGFFYLRVQKPHRGIGFALALTFMLHPVAGLPLWENESPSFFLFKSNSRGEDLLFGGVAGPFAGWGLASILLVFAVRAFYGWWKRQPAPLRT